VEVVGLRIRWRIRAIVWPALAPPADLRNLNRVERRDLVSGPALAIAVDPFRDFDFAFEIDAAALFERRDVARGFAKYDGAYVLPSLAVADRDVEQRERLSC
jgi:hypothetical protein